MWVPEDCETLQPSLAIQPTSHPALKRATDLVQTSYHAILILLTKHLPYLVHLDTSVGCEAQCQ